ncbi:DUF6783 domain-containing protein [Robinsoniella peoriensis]|uniref:DUF6783 domain-containing protein n=1 Tax=Robinsoniella peoriensis TaxID=180332 RepID=UPI003A7F22AF
MWTVTVADSIWARVCLKIHSRHLHAPLCGIFAPDSGYVARYVPFIRDKSPANCDAQLPESNFKTHSRICSKTGKRLLHRLYATAFIVLKFFHRAALWQTTRERSPV